MLGLVIFVGIPTVTIVLVLIRFILLVNYACGMLMMAFAYKQIP